MTRRRMTKDEWQRARIAAGDPPGSHGLFQVVKRNMATGGRVTKIGATYSYRPDAQRDAARRNDREQRADRNVAWTVREL